MRTLTLLSTTICAVLMATVHAAPAKQLDDRSAKLSCEWDKAITGIHLAVSDYYYGTDSFVPKMGYKILTENGKERLPVVKLDANDSTIQPLDNVTRMFCNATALNYLLSSEFGSNLPLKLLANVERHGISYCVGVQDPNSEPTDIVLVPCSDYDDESQANQFWLNHWKYNNLLPLVGKFNSSDRLRFEDAWPILPPADNSNSQSYRAGHNNGNETAYQSFVIYNGEHD